MQVNDENLCTVNKAKFKQLRSFFQNFTRTVKYLFCEALQAFLNKTLAYEEKGVLLVGHTTKSLQNV